MCELVRSISQFMINNEQKKILLRLLDALYSDSLYCLTFVPPRPDFDPIQDSERLHQPSNCAWKLANLIKNFTNSFELLLDRLFHCNICTVFVLYKLDCNGILFCFPFPPELVLVNRRLEKFSRIIFCIFQKICKQRR